jgi:DNA (cytosine-5)-methyltransferase 1
MILLDLFSGIGGFHLGLEKAGFQFKKVLFSEIDKHAIANYKYNFKNAEYAGSVTDIKGSNIPRPNIFTFGSPCQDFSISGKRKGMDGERSVLIKEAIRLIDETRPDVFIWENVKGTFSSNNGADFWAIIQAFTNVGGYRLDWQLLNTAWFLPQNRERIYLVGHLDGRSKPGVFPIGTVSRENNAIQRQQANTLTTRYTSDSEGTYIIERKQQTQVIVHNMQPRSADRPSLEYSSGGSGHLSRDNGIEYCLDTGNTNAVELIQKDYSKGKAQGERLYDTEGVSTTLSAKGGGVGGKTGLYETSLGIRKLTEIECERLQGFPDDHTKYGNYDGEIKEIARTNRYSLCGNAVTVDVVEAVGKRLKKCMNEI